MPNANLSDLGRGDGIADDHSITQFGTELWSLNWGKQNGQTRAVGPAPRRHTAIRPPTAAELVVCPQAAQSGIPISARIPV